MRLIGEVIDIIRLLLKPKTSDIYELSLKPYEEVRFASN